MVLLKGYLSVSQQAALVSELRALGTGPGGFYTPTYSSGGQLHLRMMCLGVQGAAGGRWRKPSWAAVLAKGTRQALAVRPRAQQPMYHVVHSVSWRALCCAAPLLIALFFESLCCSLAPSPCALYNPVSPRPPPHPLQVGTGSRARTATSAPAPLSTAQCRPSYQTP